MFLESLFMLDMRLESCVKKVMNDDGEIVDERIDGEELENLKMERDDKIEQIIYWIKNKRNTAEALKAEKQKLERRQKKLETDADYLEGVLKAILKGQNFDRPDKPLARALFRKSERVVVDNIWGVPEEYLRYKEPEADKTAIKKAIKLGQTFDGAHIETVENIQIK